MRTAIVVDDDPIIRLDICQILEEKGFKIVGSAGDGFDAVELCRLKKPDVVMMDVKMPIFDGLSASKVIVEEDLAGCVILLTAFAEEKVIEQATRAGVTGYLLKPIDERLLLPTIEVAFAQSERLRAAHATADKVNQKLQDSRLVEQAKGILAKEQSISESEAYLLIRKTSMDKRCSIAKLAQMIVENSTHKELLERAKKILSTQKNISTAEAFKILQQKASEQQCSLELVATEITKNYRE